MWKYKILNTCIINKLYDLKLIKKPELWNTGILNFRNIDIQNFEIPEFRKPELSIVV